jgi:hypothetical protein
VTGRTRRLRRVDKDADSHDWLHSGPRSYRLRALPSSDAAAGVLLGLACPEALGRPGAVRSASMRVSHRPAGSSFTHCKPRYTTRRRLTVRRTPSSLRPTAAATLTRSVLVEVPSPGRASGANRCLTDGSRLSNIVRTSNISRRQLQPQRSTTKGIRDPEQAGECDQWEIRCRERSQNGEGRGRLKPRTDCGCERDRKRDQAVRRATSKYEQ